MKSMKKSQPANCHAFSDAFYGSSTIGERGQLVIPADARAEMGFNPGDKILVMRHPIHHGLMLLKIEAVREFLNDFASELEQLEQRSNEEESQ